MPHIQVRFYRHHFKVAEVIVTKGCERHVYNIAKALQSLHKITVEEETSGFTQCSRYALKCHECEDNGNIYRSGCGSTNLDEFRIVVWEELFMCGWTLVPSFKKETEWIFQCR